MKAPVIEHQAEILNNIHLVKDYYLLTLSYDGIPIKPGQFVNLQAPEFYLKRPFAVFDYIEGQITLLYKVIGKGTAALAKAQKGIFLELLCPLGNSFPLDNDNSIIMAGGTGIASIYLLAKALKNPKILIGVTSKEEAQAFSKLFSPINKELHLSTNDGSVGFKGNIIEFLEQSPLKDVPSHYYACGPHGMLNALNQSIAAKKVLAKTAYVSMEARMGCGFGVCLGCAIEKKEDSSFYYVCKDGPVFPMNELKWNV